MLLYSRFRAANPIYKFVWELTTWCSWVCEGTARTSRWRTKWRNSSHETYITCKVALEEAAHRNPLEGWLEPRWEATKVNQRHGMDKSHAPDKGWPGSWTRSWMVTGTGTIDGTGWKPPRKICNLNVRWRRHDTWWGADSARCGHNRKATSTVTLSRLRWLWRLAPIRFFTTRRLSSSSRRWVGQAYFRSNIEIWPE